MRAIRIEVPGQPLSVNALYRNNAGPRGRGRFLTAEGRAFKAAIVLAARAELRADPLPFGAIAVHLELYFRTRANDIDGPIKPVLDALQEAGVFANDNQITHLSAFKFKDPERPRLTVIVVSTEGTLFGSAA